MSFSGFSRGHFVVLRDAGCLLCGARRPGAPNHVYGHCHPVMWKDGENGSKTISFSLPEKETGFGIQRKRGSRTGQVAPNRDPAARLYAPAQHQPRPQWTTWEEQGQAVVLSSLFSPPARVGVGAWWRSPVFPIHSSLFPLTFLCGARRPRRAIGTAPLPVILRPQAEESVLPSPDGTQKDGGNGSFAALRMTRR